MFYPNVVARSGEDEEENDAQKLTVDGPIRVRKRSTPSRCAQCTAANGRVTRKLLTYICILGKLPHSSGANNFSILQNRRVSSFGSAYTHDAPVE